MPSGRQETPQSPQNEKTQDAKREDAKRENATMENAPMDKTPMTPNPMSLDDVLLAESFNAMIASTPDPTKQGRKGKKGKQQWEWDDSKQFKIGKPFEKDGVWYSRIVHLIRINPKTGKPFKKRISSGTADKREAKETFRAYCKRELERLTGVKPILFRDAADEWLESFAKKVQKGEKSESTLRNYKSDIKILKEAILSQGRILGDLVVSEIRPSDIEDDFKVSDAYHYRSLGSTAETPIKREPSSQEQLNKTLKAFFKYCKGKGYLKDIPQFSTAVDGATGGIKGVRIRADEAKDLMAKLKKLTEFSVEADGHADDCVSTFVEKARLLDLFLAILIAFKSCFRIGAILRLKWEMFDFCQKVIHVPGKFTKRKGAAFEFPISDELMEVLEPLSNRKKPRDFVISSLTGRRDIPRSWYAILESLVGKTDRKGKPFTFHDCRRWYETFLKRTSVNSEGIQESVFRALCDYEGSHVSHRYDQALEEEKRAYINALPRLLA